MEGTNDIDFSKNHRVLQVKNFQATTEYEKQESEVQDIGINFKKHMSMIHDICYNKQCSPVFFLRLS